MSNAEEPRTDDDTYMMTAHVLAGLRLLQVQGKLKNAMREDIQSVATNDDTHPLATAEEIDAWCEALNTGRLRIIRVTPEQEPDRMDKVNETPASVTLAIDATVKHNAKTAAARAITDQEFDKLYEQVAHRHKAAVLRVRDMVNVERYEAYCADQSSTLATEISNELFEARAKGRAVREEAIQVRDKALAQRDTAIAQYEQVIGKLRERMEEAGIDTSNIVPFPLTH